MYKNIIKCPKCGWQYLPAEIFAAESLLGKPNNIIRDELGNIIHFNDNFLDLEEKYTCDNCDTDFIVHADMSFKTSIDEFGNFDEEYSTTIFPDRLKLKEPKDSIEKNNLFEEK